MTEFTNADFERLNSILSDQGLANDNSDSRRDSVTSATGLNMKNPTEVLMKSVRYMTPSDKLRKNRKLLSRVMSFREAILRNLMNRQRSDNEAWSLYEYVRDFKFFQQYVNIETMETEAVLHICKNIKYEKYRKDDVIFKEGDPSNGKVYILFSGSIKVIVDQLDVYERENIEHSFMQPATSADISVANFGHLSISPSVKQSRRGSLLDKDNDENCYSTPQSPRLRPSKTIHNDFEKSKEKYLKMYTSGFGDLKLNDEEPKRSRFNEKRTPSPEDSKDSRDASQISQMSREKSFASSIVSSRRSSVNVVSNEGDLDGKALRNELKQLERRPSSGRNNIKNNRTNMHRLALLKSTLERGSIDRPLNLNVPEDNSKKKQPRHHPLGYIRSIISDRGAFFGEKALETDAIRGASIVADTDLELLVLTKEVFKYIKKVFDREKRMLKDFLMKYIPNLDVISSPQILENFMFSFKDVFVEIGNHLITEGDFGETVFLLYQGTAEVSRTIIIKEPDHTEVSIKKVKEFYASKKKVKETIVVASISEGSFVGEEIILKDVKRYQYSIKVTSEKARFLATTKLKIIGRFPDESQKKVREMAQNKRTQRQNLFQELLNKRGLKLISESFDTFPLNVQRQNNLELFTGIDSKINSKPMNFNSYKILTPRIESVTPNTITSGNVQSPKPFTPRILPNFDDDRMTRTHMLNFSRKNYMPIKQIEDRLETEPAKETDTEKNENLIFHNLHIKRAISPVNPEPKKVNPIRSEESNHEFKNINQYYDQVLGKFGINNLLRETKSHIEDVNYFKLDFGTKDTPKKQRFLPNLQSSRQNEKTTRNGGRQEKAEPEFKITLATSATARHDKPLLTDLMQNLDDSILDKPKDKSEYNPTRPSQQSTEFFKIKPGGQILMPLFSNDMRSSKLDKTKTLMSVYRDSVPNFAKTMNQIPRFKSPRANIQTHIPINTQKLITKLKKTLHKPSTEIKIIKKPEISEVSRIKSPKKVSMEIFYYSGLNSPPRKINPK